MCWSVEGALNMIEVNILLFYSINSGYFTKLMFVKISFQKMPKCALTCRIIPENDSKCQWAWTLLINAGIFQTPS